MNDENHSGGCACGAVRFTVHGALSEVVACHCQTCRRLSGYYWAATHADWSDLVVETTRALAWYNSSTSARRAFCRECGSTLFFRQHASATVSISPGALDDASALSTVAHICTAEAGGYYPLPDDVARHTGLLPDDANEA